MVPDSGDRIIHHVSTETQTQATDTLIELLSGCARRDEVAFSQLYRASAAQLLAQLLRALKVQSYAEEALQNTYNTVWHHAQDYRADLGNPMLWMQAIARKEARKILSEQKNWQAIPDDSTTEPLRDISLPAELAELDTASRQCLIALYCEGLTLDCLADKTSESVVDIRNKVRDVLHQISENADESA